MSFIASHILSLIILIPLAGMVVVMLLPRDRVSTIRWVAALTGMLSFALSLFLYLVFDRTATGFQFVERIPWLPSLGIAYLVGVDGINLLMVLLTGILTLAVCLVSWNIRERVREYFALTLASLAGTFGLFCSLDLFFFILFYELASIPMYFLIGIWGSDRTAGGRTIKKEYAATKLILYLQLGGGLVFLGILGLVFLSGAGSFDFTVLKEKIGALGQIQRLLFPLIFLGFAIETGYWPLHTWLPDGHSAAPTALSMLLAGVLLKMGGYGILRLGVELLPQGAVDYLPWFACLAVVNVLYGALCALNQTDLKYIIAYSSISHMGIVILGMAALNPAGLSGSVFQMFSHGVITALLFALAGYLYEKTHSRDITRHGGLGIKAPYLAAVFVMGGLATLGLPGMSGFVAEVLVFLGLYQGNTLVGAAFRPWYPVFSVLSILGLVITATYVLRAVQRIFYGPLNPAYQHLQDAVGVEKIPLALLLAAAVIFGFVPSWLVHPMSGAVSQILQRLAGGS